MKKIPASNFFEIGSYETIHSYLTLLWMKREQKSNEIGIFLNELLKYYFKNRSKKNLALFNTNIVAFYRQFRSFMNI